MPLVLQATLAWALGTAAGLTIGAPPALLVCGALVVLALWWRGHASGAARASGAAANREQLGALGLLALAGLLAGAQARAGDLRCVAQARARGEAQVQLLGDAAPGAFTRGEMQSATCRVHIAVAVARGEAPAGATVALTFNELTEGERGPLVRGARVRVLRAPGPLARWRARVAARLDRLFGPDGPMVRALLIADTRGLDPLLRERYADAGLVHMLSISGLHVAIVGGALLLALGALRVGRGAAGVGAVAITVLYVVAIGAPAPAVRSATLFAASQCARLWQRPISPWGSFALGAAVPLVELRTVLDLGYQLSVGGYAAIVVAGRLGPRLSAKLRGWRATLGRELTAGTLSTLATAPLIAWHFGRLSLIAPFSNLVAGPIIALLQPTLFAAMLLPERFGAPFVADAARPLLRALDATAAAGASLPGAAVVVAPTLVAALVSGVAVLALLVAGWARDWARPAIVAIGAVALLAWAPAAPRHGPPVMEVHMIDVGQGDAIALRTPRGRWVLVDAGRAWRSGDAGRATVIPYLRRHGGALALFVLTHPHSDHVGGAASVIEALRPREIRDAAFVEANPTYRETLDAAQRVGARWQRVRPGERIELDGVTIDFLAPDSAWTASLDDPNEASSIVRATFGATRVLLTGDAEGRQERWLLEQDATALAADVLKVAHHGSRTSTSDAFVEAVAPRLALVSVGQGNSYGHPSPEVMRRLVEAGATVLRTDQLGSLIVRSDGRTLEVEAAGHRWPVRKPLP